MYASFATALIFVMCWYHAIQIYIQVSQLKIRVTYLVANPEFLHHIEG